MNCCLKRHRISAIVISRTLSSYHPLHPIKHSLYILTCFAEVLEWSCRSGMSGSFSYCIHWYKLSRAPCFVKKTGFKSLLMPRNSFRYLQSRYQRGPADAVEVEGVTASKSALKHPAPRVGPPPELSSGSLSPTRFRSSHEAYRTLPASPS